jgi:hypothetical protein
VRQTNHVGIVGTANNIELRAVGLLALLAIGFHVPTMPTLAPVRACLVRAAMLRGAVGIVGRIVSANPHSWPIQLFTCISIQYILDFS